MSAKVVGMGQPNLGVWVWWVRGSGKLSIIAEREGAMISPQAHGGVVAFQGRSHKDNVKLLGYNVSRFAK